MDTGDAAIAHPDSVDRLIGEWETIEPDLDVAVIGVVHRIRRVRVHLEEALEANFATNGLTGTGFGVLSVLIRAGEPHQMSQRRLTELLQLTPGTVSLRIDKLEEQGLVVRSPDPDDRRSTLVTLTAAGRDRFDQTAPSHLELQERLVSALSDSQRAQLAGLLRVLLANYEPISDPSCPTVRAGLTVAPSHEARRLQVQLGMDERSGLLVQGVQPGSPAEEAGLLRGDLLIGLDGAELSSVTDLSSAIVSGSAFTLRVERGATTANLRWPDPT